MSIFASFVLAPPAFAPPRAAMFDADCKTDSLLTAGDPAVFEVFPAGFGVSPAGFGVSPASFDAPSPPPPRSSSPPLKRRRLQHHAAHPSPPPPRSSSPPPPQSVKRGRAAPVTNASPTTPVIVCCDHAGLQVPARLGALGLPASAFATHIAADIGARQVSEMLARRLGAPLLLANYSRLVIDLNRHLDDPTLIPAASDGVEIPANAGLTAAHRRRRIDELFAPYHAAYGRLVDAAQARFAGPLIVAVHSFAPRIRAQAAARPWDFGVLWEEQREVAAALIANLRAAGRDLCIGDNQPYHATAPRGYALDAHAQARGVDMALIEIRQDHIARAPGQRWAAEVLHRAIAPLIDDTPAAPAAARAVQLAATG